MKTVNWFKLGNGHVGSRAEEFRLRGVRNSIHKQCA